jgi:hypothetical protein
MRTLIIPDIHIHTRNADHWLHSQQYDHVVFLGDYFDDFNDTPGDAMNTARWLCDRMDSGTDIFLLGNHDAAYLFPDSPQLGCSGFTREKYRAIHEVLKPRHWERFQIAHFEQGWPMSHAGFHPGLIKAPTVKKILSRCEKAMDSAGRRIVDPILGAGKDRGGPQEFGGPLWLDFGSLVPIPQINQLVGHTPGRRVRESNTANSRNYCIDVRNASAAAILCDEKLTILTKE